MIESEDQAAPAVDEAPEAEPTTGAEESAHPRAAKAPKGAKPAEAPEPPDVPHGTALLDHDDPDAGASFNGVELARGGEGLFLVPLAAVEHLVSHGFRLIGAGE